MGLDREKDSLIPVRSDWNKSVGSKEWESKPLIGVKDTILIICSHMQNTHTHTHMHDYGWGKKEKSGGGSNKCKV